MVLQNGRVFLRKKCMKLYYIFSSFHIRLKLIICKTIFFYRIIFLNAQCMRNVEHILSERNSL